MQSKSSTTRSVTSVAGSDGWYYRTSEEAKESFTPQVFELSWLQHLAASRSVEAHPRAFQGRGSVCFFQFEELSLVYKQYRRGGLPAKITPDRYVWTGLPGTRAWKEFDLLCELQKLSLNAPTPWACAVQRQGLFYRAYLITKEIEAAVSLASVAGNAVAEASPLEAKANPSGTRNHEMWTAAGVEIRRFHDAGLCHADLNAGNILFDAQGNTYLIDFDQSELRPQADSTAWKKKNLSRLQRSLQKLLSAQSDSGVGTGGSAALSREWDLLMAAYNSGHTV